MEKNDKKLKDEELLEMLKKMEEVALGKNAPIFELEKQSAKDPFKILVYTMLSARTKDSTTLRVGEKLFERFPTKELIAKANIKEIEEVLFEIGFFRTKAKNLKKLSHEMVELGEIPKTTQELVKLSGVGRKTANIVLARIYDTNTIGVDVHVHRISNRLGLVKTKKPFETEKELVRIIPEKIISKLNRIFVAYGQSVCKARKPDCQNCQVQNKCKQIGV